MDLADDDLPSLQRAYEEGSVIDTELTFAGGGGGGDITLETGEGSGGPDGALILHTRGTFLRRIWFLFSAPFRYLLVGKIKL